MMNNRKDLPPFLTLPPDMLRLIFSQLTIQDLAALSLVCREFKKRADQAEIQTSVIALVDATDQHGKSIRRKQKVKVAGTYAALRDMMSERKPKEGRREKLNNSCFVKTDMDDVSCQVVGGGVTLGLSMLGTLGVTSGLQTAGYAFASALWFPVSVCGGFTLFGCAVTQGVRKVNQCLRDERDQLNNELRESDYDKVRVITMSEDEAHDESEVEYVEDDSRPLLNPDSNLYTGYAHFAQMPMF